MRRRRTTIPTDARRETRSPGEPLARSARTMLAAATHEIRAPMHTILGMSELLGRTTLTPAQQQYLDALQRAAQQLTELLDTVMESQRAPSGERRRERLWLPEVIEGAVAVVRSRAEQAGLELAVTTNTDVPRRLLGDRVRLQQVLANLLSNAVKYTPAGAVRLTVRRVATTSSESTEDDVTLAFDVEDTGPGIAAERLPGLFAPWARQPEHSHLEGVGLGLHITKQLVSEMGGTLTVKSRTQAELEASGGTGSVGTTFTVTLAVGIGDKPSDSAASVAIRGIAFLVVGPRHFGEVVERALSPWSPRMRFAPDASAAREQLAEARDQQQPIHAIVVDNEAFDELKDLSAEHHLLVAVPQVSLLRLGNEVERVNATPILLPVTTANLYAAVTRAFRPRPGDVDSSEFVVEGPPLAGATIFAADDDPDARVLMRAFLDETGARVETFASIAELSAAIVVAQQGEGSERTLPMPDVILCDVEMPDGGARAFRTSWPTLSVPVVPVTAHSDDSARDLESLGFPEIGRKPLTRDALQALIRRHLPRPLLPPRAMTPLPMVSTPPPMPSVAGAPTPGTDEMHAMQLEARMALARRDYRGLSLLARRLKGQARERLEAAAKQKDDARIRELLKDLDAPATVVSTDDAIRALLPEYLERRARDVQDITEALAAQRFEDIAFIGHRLIGTARTYGMPGLGEVGTLLEAAGRARDGATVSQQLARMRDILRAASQYRHKEP